MRDVTTLRRSTSDRMVAGVCEGLSRHLDIDPIVVRVLFAALTLFGGAGLVLYVLAWLTVPADNEYDSVVSGWLRRDPERILVAGVTIAAVAAVVTMIGAIGVSAPNPFPAVVVGLAALTVFALFTRRPADSSSQPAPEAPGMQPPQSLSTQTPSTDTLSTQAQAEHAPEASAKLTPTPPTGASSVAPPPHEPRSPRTPRPPRPPRERPRLLGMTLAVTAIAVGVIWVLDETVVAELEPSVYPGTALALIAAALLIGTRYGRSRFLIVLGLLASLATVATTVVGPGPHGESLYRPLAADEVRSSYEHGIGHLVVHLDDVSDVARLAGRDIVVDMSVGRLDIIIPTSLDATITAHVRGGEINGPPMADRRDSGSESATVTPVDDADPNVTIDIDLQFGQINLMRVDCPGDTDSAAKTGLDLTYEPTGGTRVPAACN